MAAGRGLCLRPQGTGRRCGKADQYTRKTKDPDCWTADRQRLVGPLRPRKGVWADRTKRAGPGQHRDGMERLFMCESGGLPGVNVRKGSDHQRQGTRRRHGMARRERGPRASNLFKPLSEGSSGHCGACHPGMNIWRTFGIDAARRRIMTLLHECPCPCLVQTRSAP